MSRCIRGYVWFFTMVVCALNLLSFAFSPLGHCFSAPLGLRAECLREIDHDLDWADFANAELRINQLQFLPRDSTDVKGRFELDILQRRVRLATCRGDSSALSMAAQLISRSRSSEINPPHGLAADLIEQAKCWNKFARTASTLPVLAEARKLLTASGQDSSLLMARAGHETAVFLLNRGEAKDAELWLLKALVIRRARLGSKHPEFARTLLYLGIVKLQTNRALEARPDYEEALARLKESLGATSPDYLWALNSYAAYLQSQGELDTAKRHYNYIIETRRRLKVADDLSLAWCVYNLGIIAQEHTQFTAAESLYSEAYRLRTHFLGKQHPLSAKCQAALGGLSFLKGDYALARAPLEEALATFRASGQGTSFDAGNCLLNLGTLHYWLGEPTLAKECLEAALPILLVKGRPRDRVICHQRLGEALAATGQVEQAENHYRQALRIPGAALNIQAGVRVDFALLLTKASRFASADSHFAAAIQEIEQIEGTEAAELMWALSDYGHTLVEEGSFGRAEVALERAITLFQRVLHGAHPDYVRSLVDLSRCQQALENLPRSWDEAVTASRAETAHLCRNVVYMTERHALQYGQSRDAANERLLSVLAAMSAPSEAQILEAWTAVANRRSFVLDEMLTRNETAFVTGSARKERQALTQAKMQLANLFVRGRQFDDAGTYTQLLLDAVNTRDRRERDWAKVTARRTGRVESFKIEQVLGRLEPGECLVAFVRYRAGVSLLGKERCARFGAFVGTSSGSVHYLVLKQASDIEKAAADYLKHCSQAADQLQRSPTEAEQDYRLLGNRVREVVWDDIAPLLKEATKVVVVADGPLMNISFASLPKGNDQFLIDEPQDIELMTAERDLLRASVREGRGLMAIANPEFGTVPEMGGPKANAGRIASAPSENTNRAFEALPQSEVEVREVVRLWNLFQARHGRAALLSGSDATEEAFMKAAPGSSVVHVATHTIGLTGPETEGSRNLSNQPELEAYLKSGLAFANANVAGDVALASDGIVTAEEVGSMNLNGVGLAVLSACSSGRGLASRGEGVLGLRRAFQLAGARRLLISLWPVGDRGTLDWMSIFYKHLWAKAEYPARACLSTSRELLAERRSEKRCTHPFYWGGFIVIGSPH